MGNRIAKHVLTSEDVLEKSTYYVLDASGNTMSVYERTVDEEAESVEFYQAEKHVYGSSRLGVLEEKIPLLGSQNSTYSMQDIWHRTGLRNYELFNHLGNVLTTISDKIMPHDDDADNVVDWYLADIRTAQDYSPFGVTLSGRNFTLAGAEEFRYGYQGSEKEDEVKGEGNSYTTHFRLLDPRLGRWLTIDPVFQPSQSPYNSMDNNPILHNDPLGDKVKYGAESGKERRELRKMIREARKHDVGFDLWYKGKRSDRTSVTTLRLTGNEANVPTNFTSPKYVASGGSNQGGSFINIDGAGNETNGNTGNNDGNYYFPRLERLTTKLSNESTGNYANIGGLVPGFGFDMETQSYKSELNIDPGLFLVSGLAQPFQAGASTVNFRITDANNNEIANYNINQIRLDDGVRGVRYGPMLFNTTTSKILIQVTMVTSSAFIPTGNWSVKTTTWKTKTNNTWRFNPMRLFRREGLGNL